MCCSSLTHKNYYNIISLKPTITGGFIITPQHVVCVIYLCVIMQIYPLMTLALVLPLSYI